MSLIVFTGPMYSGKTSSLINEYEKYLHSAFKYNLLTINHVFDEKRTEKHIIKNHNNKSIKANYSVKFLTPILKEIDYKEAHVIFIDECQFFTDLYEFCLESSKIKNIYVAGLCGDFKRELFGEIYKLLPISTDFIFLKSVCAFCNNIVNAPFSHRFTEEKDKIIIGSDDKYKPVCLKHFLEKNN